MGRNNYERGVGGGGIKSEGTACVYGEGIGEGREGKSR